MYISQTLNKKKICKMINYLANCRHSFFCDYFLFDQKFAFKMSKSQRDKKTKLFAAFSAEK
jgi:hypothetical protein